MAGRVTEELLQEWVNKGEPCQATHLLVVYYDRDRDYFPVYVEPGEKVEEKIASMNKEEGCTVVREYSIMTAKDWEKFFQVMDVMDEIFENGKARSC